jgi:hypothetical protein
MPLSISCTNDEKVLVSVKPVSKGGNIVKLDGPITVAVQSGNGTLEVQADGLSFFAISGPDVSTTEYTLTAVATGVTVSDTITLVVTQAALDHLDLSAATPVLK